ncbi:uracil-DNA glycosylase [Paenisporosarcina indica]|uniref:uracil-DNA glycosylase n=1 Tax=Paenisporosarcina indica TaxID=650093 RepID=UPI00094F4CE3|nr:uracil-DNA glycosylase [Paenisporosarcina indica]
MTINIGSDWGHMLASEFEKPYYLKLREFLKEQYENETIYPPMNDLWSAFRETAFEEVRVVIIGQDPYHGPGQAHGMSFSVKEAVKIPPSLRNMLKELQADLGCDMPEHGSLTKWAKQGVLLLNTVLTVRAGAAHSHKGQGWETFTDEVIRKLSARDNPIIFVLWGRPAQMKRQLIDPSRHAILESVHPSPLSAHRGFLGSKPYSKINKQLIEWGNEPIDFCLK